MAGYNEELMMSNKAVESYEKGEKPLSGWTHDALMEALAEAYPNDMERLPSIPTAIIRHHFLFPTGAHHVGKNYRMEEFYGFVSDYSPSQIDNIIRIHDRATGRIERMQLMHSVIAGKGSLRFIVQPGTMDIVIDGEAFYDGDIPVNFDNEKNRNVTLEAGQFKQYNMKYDGVSSEVTTRDLEPGDYYYSDGSIYPYGKGNTGFNNPPTEGCIGVIFETTTGAPDTEWTHGSVLALVNAHKDWSAWGGQNEPFEGNNTAGFTDDTKRRNFLLSHMDGYQFTSLLAEGKGECAVTKVTSFGTGDYAAYAAPVPATSGWYMPSSGQYAALMEHLGGYAFTTDNVESTAGEYRDGKAAALAAIESALTKVGGYLWDSDGDTESFQRWWSSTESDNVNEWCIEWKRDGQIKLLTRNKTQSWNTPKTYARAVLSF